MNITKGIPYPLGVHIDNEGVNFAFVSTKTDCGVVLFSKDTMKEWKRIPFAEEYTIGNIQCMYISGISLKDKAYCFYEEDRLITDVRGRAYFGGYIYAEEPKYKEDVRPALFSTDDSEWKGDVYPHIPYEESICYCLHVRGFTRHTSSKVKAKGTFLGLVDKIPYLKELGITTLELQPVYEFPEIEKKKRVENPFENPFEDAANPTEDKINYWGYAGGYYYSPKNSYAYSKDAESEFKFMIKELHKNKIEVILQFYFTKYVPEREIPEILRYWVINYHVDGFHLKGENINTGVLANDPALAKTKLWYYNFPEKKTELVRDLETGKLGGSRYLAEYQDDYRYEMRRFLKGEEGTLSSAMHHLRYNPIGCGKINYLTNYDGFTLMDLVSYDQKHNEKNGEDNRDGNEYNGSWNCGQEGRSRKKAVTALRMKQIKNALLILFLSQATPLLFMGDEFGNSQEGNNNPYCQDNITTWLNWKDLDKYNEIYEYTKQLILLRKEHPVLRQEKELRMMDYGACGYPDVSYHGEVPWKPNTSNYSRQLGIMYCGKYAYKDKKTPDDFFYVVYNMHWEEHDFAMPNLPKGMCWELYMTSETETLQLKDVEEQLKIRMPERCICLFKSKEIKKKGSRKKGKSSKT